MYNTQPASTQRHWYDAAAIDYDCFPSDFMTSHDLLEVSRSGRAIIVATDCHDSVLGYSIVKKSPRDIELQRIAVATWHRRAGVGASLIANAIEIAKRNRIQIVSARPDDTMLPLAHAFLSGVGGKQVARNRNRRDGSASKTVFHFDLSLQKALARKAW